MPDLVAVFAHGAEREDGDQDIDQDVVQRVFLLGFLGHKRKTGGPQPARE